MDTILIANESLKHLPDSIQTFQSTLKESDFWHVTIKDIIQITVSVFGVAISVTAIILTYRNNKQSQQREQQKEDSRVAKLKAHVIYYLRIIRYKIIIQAQNTKYSFADEELFSFGTMPEILEYDLPFNKILDLPTIDLTEVLIIKSKDPDANIIKVEYLEDINLNYKSVIKENNELRKKFIDSFNAKKQGIKYLYDLMLEYDFANAKFSKELVKDIITILNLYNGHTLIYTEGGEKNIVEGIKASDLLKDELKDEPKFKSYLHDYSVALTEMKLFIEKYKYEFKKVRQNIYKLARSIEKIEKYYEEKITNEEYDSNILFIMTQKEMDRIDNTLFE